MVIENMSRLKRFSASVTDILLARVMKTLMLRQTCFDWEAGIAYVAEEILLTCVQLHMITIVVVRCEMTITHLAVELLALLMDEYMGIEMALGKTALAANLTSERLIL